MERSIIPEYHPAEIEFGDLELPSRPVLPEWRTTPIPVPAIDHADARILREIERMPERWDMNVYNTIGLEHRADPAVVCESAHCMAGWLVHICGMQGYRLLRTLGGGSYQSTAKLIYEASCPGKPVPCFEPNSCGTCLSDDEYNARHLDLLRQRAAADPLPPDESL